MNVQKQWHINWGLVGKLIRKRGDQILRKIIAISAAALILGTVFTLQYKTTQKQAVPGPIPAATSAPRSTPAPIVTQSSSTALPQQKAPIMLKQAPVGPVPVVPAPVGPGPIVSIPAPFAKPSEQPVASPQYEQKVLQLVNQERNKAGLSALTMDNGLTKAALAKAQDMYKNNYFDHNSPTYGSPFDMMKKFGVNFNAAGENIAKGQTSPQQVMKDWMNSEGHRANILNSSYTKIGIAQYNREWVQEFIG
jgi:uncharacterized YkwD family protein